MKKIVILQSNYIPWKGYLDLMNRADEFILFDDVQYTRRDWRNRNTIKTPDGLLWLTIPVDVKGKFSQAIKDVKVSDKSWNKRHWQTIVNFYSQARYFKHYKDLFEELYAKANQEYLSEVNQMFLVAIKDLLGVKTILSRSSDYPSFDGKTERLLSLCKAAGASEYISGPSAKDYIKPVLFEEAKIKLTWMDYSGYQPYEQLYPPFEHQVTVLDLIFNTGPQAQHYMKSFAL